MQNTTPTDPAESGPTVPPTRRTKKDGAAALDKAIAAYTTFETAAKQLRDEHQSADPSTTA